MFIEVSRLIVHYLSILPDEITSKEYDGQSLLRRVMIQNTARGANYNMIFDNKADEYVKNIFSSCGVEVKNMNLDNEILKLVLMKKGSVVPVRQGDDVTYLCRDVNGYAVAIPYNDEKVLNESFVGITLSTNMLNVEDKSFKVLYLYMVETGDIKKFAYIAAEFIDLENRENLLSNPYSWIDAWNEMFGNSKKKYMISDVLAELAAFKEMYKQEKSANGLAPQMKLMTSFTMAALLKLNLRQIRKILTFPLTANFKLILMKMKNYFLLGWNQSHMPNQLIH